MKQTTDIRLASAFKALGANLVGVDKKDVRHMIFKFESPKFDSPNLPPTLDLDKIELEWANGCVTGNFVDYAEAFASLKSIVHSG